MIQSCIRFYSFDLPQEFVSALEEDLEVNDSAPVVEAIPEGVYDFDASVKDDPHQGTTYVVDTFNYYKNREVNNQATQELQISERQNLVLMLNISIPGAISGTELHVQDAT